MGSFFAARKYLFYSPGHPEKMLHLTVGFNFFVKQDVDLATAPDAIDQPAFQFPAGHLPKVK
jgi:hypothetical protein